MLILRRRVGESIVIDDRIKVTVCSARGDNVKLGIVAPRDVVVDREEVAVSKKLDGVRKCVAD